MYWEALIAAVLSDQTRFGVTRSVINTCFTRYSLINQLCILDWIKIEHAVYWSFWIVKNIILCKLQQSHYKIFLRIWTSNTFKQTTQYFTDKVVFFYDIKIP